jgi:pectin methylesterase-like acyl-CoA thioesterase
MVRNSWRRIVASGKTRDEVQRAVDAVLPENKRKAVYIFELG